MNKNLLLNISHLQKINLIEILFNSLIIRGSQDHALLGPPNDKEEVTLYVVYLLFFCPVKTWFKLPPKVKVRKSDQLQFSSRHSRRDFVNPQYRKPAIHFHA